MMSFSYSVTRAAGRVVGCLVVRLGFCGSLPVVGALPTVKSVTSCWDANRNSILCTPNATCAFGISQLDIDLVG
jgi:hypothetical protein